MVLQYGRHFATLATVAPPCSQDINQSKLDATFKLSGYHLFSRHLTHSLS
jgi:hypothetical protein